MAALECNNGQDGFSPTENGEALPEEKSLSIDYSEDLWLANSEDSSGPYPQQPNKILSQDSSGGQVGQLTSYAVTSNEHHPTGEQSTDDSEVREVQQTQYATAEAGNGQSQNWAQVMPGEGGERSDQLDAANGYMNGVTEQNGMELNSSGEEKDFAQLMPAGSYVEGSGVVAMEQQDKTFTSLMPAAALGVNGDLPAGYTGVLSGDQQQMIYYRQADHMTSDSSGSVVNQDGVTVTYQTSGEIETVNGEGGGGEEEASGPVYVSMEAINTEGQTTVTGPGSLTVLSPAMLNMAPVSSEGEQTTYSSQLATPASYQHISTLPFVQNGAYTAQSGYTSYQESAAANVDTNDQPLSQGQIKDEQDQEEQILPQAEYTTTQASYGSQATSASLHPGAIDYEEEGQEEEDEEDEDEEDDGTQDMEDNSGQFSEFSCPMCSEAFVDQASLDDHVNNHPPLKTFVCTTCGKGFATRRYLKYHRKNHCKRAGSYEGRNDLDDNDPNAEVKRFACNICSRPFRVLKCMKVHKKKKHGILKEFTCQNCAITYSSSQELIDHHCEPKSAPSTPQVIQYTPPPLAVPSQKKKRKLKQAKPACDICGKTFSDRISVDIHRVKHIEEELYPCDMCGEVEGVENHLAVHFRIRFFTDDNQHILEDQKAAVATHDANRSDEGASLQNPGTPLQGSITPQSAPATPIYLPATPTPAPGTPISANCIGQSEGGLEVGTQLIDQTGGTSSQVIDQSGFAQKYAEFAASQVGAAQVGQTSQGYTVSSFVMAQNETLIVTDQSVLINQQGNQQQQHQQAQHIYTANFEEGEIIHDASGSVMAVTPKKKKFKRTKIHMCDICNKSFSDTAKLDLHYKSNHLHDRPYQCDVCDKSFFTKWKLQRHMLSHLEQKPHSCPMCSKSFVERGKLEAHYRTHLGTKPYKCDQCPKAFTVKSQLSIHQRRIHSTDQPFGCLVCGKAFLWKSGLDKHMRKHTREKPYICETCGMKYSNKANLIVHMSKAHNQTYVDKPGQ